MHVRDYDLDTKDTSSYHVCGRPVLAAAASACVVRQSGTNFRRMCETQSLENSLSVDLRAGYSSVRRLIDDDSRRAVQMDLLTYLLTYLQSRALCYSDIRLSN